MTEVLEKQDADLQLELADALNRVELLQESMARLELQREDIGWQLLTEQGQRDMSRQGVIDRAKLHRVLFAGNPIARRGGILRAHYVFGDGLGFTADDPDVNAVIQEHVDDTVNRQVMYGAPALERLENANYTDGNVFIANPTDPMTGKVTHRLIPVEQIVEILHEPGDATQVQYYVRQWEQRDPSTGQTLTRRVAYPHIRHMPRTQYRRIPTGINQTTVVDWNTPVIHIAPNRQVDQQWGMADILPVVPWIEKYKDFLIDWSMLVKALQTIAWEVQGQRSDQAAQMRAQADQLGATPAGSTAVMTGEGKLQAVNKSGATIDSDSAKPLLAMVAAGLGIPMTVLSNDPGQVGSHNTAETLNPPMRKGFRARQSLWEETFRQIFEYVLLKAVESPRGALRRKATIEQKGDTRVLVPRQQESLHVQVDFPSLDEHDVTTLTEALERIKRMDIAPDGILLKEALRSIGVKQVDEIVDQMTDENGQFIPPSVQTQQAAGQSAMNALRRGEDPARYLTGQES